MELRAKADAIGTKLDELFPAPPIPLDHVDPFTLLVAVALSAQTTDKKVNEVTPALFARAPDAKTMQTLEVEEILGFIRQVGLAPTKAKNLRRMSELLVERHDGVVPQDMDALEALPGVGHKTASVVMTQAFGVPAFPVDTHIHRLATRWGLSSGKNVEQTEKDLKALFPIDTWNRRHLQIIYFGRAHCPALRHDAAACPICVWAGVPEPAAERAPGVNGKPRSASKKSVEKVAPKRLAKPAPAKKRPKK
jgi:endonuclease-3